MEKKLLASILSADFGYLAQQIKMVEDAGTDMIHIDIMDNQFVPNLTIGPVVVECIRKYSKLPFDVHLMTTKPETLIAPFAHAGANLLAVHYEASTHLHGIIHTIKKNGMKAGISLNPATSLSTLDEILNDVDFILLMSVNPGFPAQSFIQGTLGKIASIKKILTQKHLETPVEVDGGIKLENVRDVLNAGADWIVSGSGVFFDKDPSSKVKELKQILTQY